MGREIKRVALNFDWPLDKVWRGFLNPHYEGHSRSCAACDGSGYSPEAKRLQDLWYGYVRFDPRMTGSDPFTADHPIVREKAERNVVNAPEYYGNGEHAIAREAQRLADLFNARWSHHLDADDIAALLEDGRLMDFTHNPRTPEQAEIVKQKIATGGNSWLPESNGYVPTPKEVNEWSICSFGHDGINSYAVIKAKCKRLGVSETCPGCNGAGSTWDSPENKQLAKDWKMEEPPAGDGWQVWETVSEGSPITPVYDTAEKLIDHLALYGDLWDQKRGHPGWGYEAAKAFVGVGWAPSGASKDGKFFESKDVALEMSK
jgi:hypothetical protein